MGTLRMVMWHGDGELPGPGDKCVAMRLDGLGDAGEALGFLARNMWWALDYPKHRTGDESPAEKQTA